MMTAVRFHRLSHNKKLAPIEYEAVHNNPLYRRRPIPRAPFCSSTYASIQATCDDVCPFKRDAQGRPGGCFADSNFTRKAMVMMDTAAEGRKGREVIADEVREIDSVWPKGIPQDGARGGRDLRIHVGGDVPDELSARMLAGAAARWLARAGGRVWSYTHAWRSIAAEAFWPIAVLASCETADQVLEARARGYAPALVVERFPNGKKAFELAGTTFIPCLAETVGTTCVKCRLCLTGDLFERGAGIAFQVHGRDGAAARAALVQLGRRVAA